MLQVKKPQYPFSAITNMAPSPSDKAGLNVIQSMWLAQGLWEHVEKALFPFLLSVVDPGDECHWTFFLSPYSYQLCDSVHIYVTRKTSLQLLAL